MTCTVYNSYYKCFFCACTCRSLHANGIDELLVFLGSNPEEVRPMFIVHSVRHCVTTTSAEAVVYACYGDLVSDAARTSKLCITNFDYSVHVDGNSGYGTLSFILCHMLCHCHLCIGCQTTGHCWSCEISY